MAAGLLIATCLSLFTAERLERSWFDDSLKTGNEFIVGSERLLSALKDVETGQRGYLLTGDEAYLEPFNAAVPELRTELDRLAMLNLPMDGLPGLVETRLAMAAAGIQVRRTRGLDEAVAAINGGHGKQVMDAIRLRISTLNADAQRHIEKGARRADWQSLVLTVLSLLALAGSIACVAVYAVRRRRESRAAEQRMRESEERFRHLAENSAAIIWTTSARGRFETEQAQWSAFTGQAGRTPGGRTRSIRRTGTAHCEPGPGPSRPQTLYVTDHRMRRADGEWRHMAVQGVPVLDERRASASGWAPTPTSPNGDTPKRRWRPPRTRRRRPTAPRARSWPI